MRDTPVISRASTATPDSSFPPASAPRRTRADGSPSTWPHDLSHEPTLRIGEVRRALTDEFPMLSVSKIRHYESIDLISPYRTATNQRLFSTSDTERLRFILREQRDRFLPLDQIREELRQLDEGIIEAPGRPGGMRAVAAPEVRRPKPGERITQAELADMTGAALGTIEELVTAGILATDARGRLSAQSADIVRYCVMLLEGGYDLRQIRSVKNSAHAQAVMLTTQLATELAKKTPVASERALNQAAEDGTTIARLYGALLTENVEVELR
ncbi:transcriptional regulator FtsR [Actinotignum sp. GS-2025a]|uniref:transcriptional regulator FtsR n=1 Tax=Actinotignum sp. GS-2025a TaxID=3427274 RepID=UPI003F481411